jgi:hypothetical protein
VRRKRERASPTDTPHANKEIKQRQIHRVRVKER